MRKFEMRGGYKCFVCSDLSRRLVSIVPVLFFDYRLNIEHLMSYHSSWIPCQFQVEEVE